MVYEFIMIVIMRYKLGRHFLREQYVHVHTWQKQ